MGASAERALGQYEELAAARILVESGFPRQATSRAYYAAFYPARAALESARIPPPKTHSGLRTRFSQFAHVTPEIGSEVGRALSQLETARTDADYGEPRIGAEEANGAIARAEFVIDVVESAMAGRLGSGQPP